MARVTVEDCIEKVMNRFELVMVASQRARKIGSGAPLTLERNNDKNPVVSLREIAEDKVEVDDLKEELVRSHQRVVAYEEDDEAIDLMDGEAEWNSMSGEGSEAPAAPAVSDEKNIYGDEEVVEDKEESADPSLADLAGNATEE